MWRPNYLWNNIFAFKTTLFLKDELLLIKKASYFLYVYFCSLAWYSFILQMKMQTFTDQLYAHQGGWSTFVLYTSLWFVHM